MILAFSSISTIQLRLPAGNDNLSLIHIVGSVRDTLDCRAEFNVSSVMVVPDLEEITNFVNSLQQPDKQITNNPFAQILASGNQNIIGQVISSLSQEFNKINEQTVEYAVASKQMNSEFHFCDAIPSLDGIPAINIVVSPLGSQTQQTVSYCSSLNI
jgi:hypothetical protein